MADKIDPLKIIGNYYFEHTYAYHILLEHSRMVAQKALSIAKQVTYLYPDMRFVEEAAMLHDIGIFMTASPILGCQGSEQYIAHGYLGRELLEKEGFMRHALVCERHVGAGLSMKDIREHNLPVPIRDMFPVSLEEKIICYADKFFSKNPGAMHTEKTLQEVRQEIATYGLTQLRRFDEMSRLFNR